MRAERRRSSRNPPGTTFGVPFREDPKSWSAGISLDGSCPQNGMRCGRREFPEWKMSRRTLRELSSSDAPGQRKDRKSGVWGKSVSVRVDLGGRRIIKKKKRRYKEKSVK